MKSQPPIPPPGSISSLFVTSVLLLFTAVLWAQPSADSVHASPYHAVYNHLYYLQQENYNPKQAAKSFPGSDVQRNTKLAIQLKQILDGRGMYVDVNMIPDEWTVRDSTSRQIYVLFELLEPLIYLERLDSGWSYSRTTVHNIPKLHKEVYPLGTNLIRQFATPKWERKFLNIKAWQWLGLLSLLVAAIVVHRILTLIFRLTIPRLARRRFIFSPAEIKTVRRSSRAISLFIVARALILFLPTLLLAPKAAMYMIRFMQVLSIVFLSLFLLSIVDLLMVYANRAAERTASAMDDQVVPVARRIIKGVIILAGVIYILKLMAVNVTALLAGISIGGLALALAAQDTVKNLIGSLVIFIDRPFQIGDWISFNDVDGTVEEVGIRSTRVRTFENSVTYVPNGKLMDLMVNNMGVRVFRRFKTNIAITYDTPPHIIDAFVSGIREMILNHPHTRKDNFEVHLNSFGDSSLNILLYLFFKVPTWSDELVSKHQLMLGIIQLAESLGVRFAFPTSTLFVEEFPGTTSLTPSANMDMEDIRRRLEDHLKRFKKEVNPLDLPKYDHESED